MTYDVFISNLESYDCHDRRFNLSSDLNLLKQIYISYDDMLTTTHIIKPSECSLIINPTVLPESEFKYILATVAFAYMSDYHCGMYKEDEIELINAGITYLLALLYHQDLDNYNFEDLFETKKDTLINLNSILVIVKDCYHLILRDLQ